MKDVRKLNTILFADIKGYTAIMQGDEAKAMELLQTFKKILKTKVSAFEGKIVQYFGDGCLLSFDSAILGVQCAISLQQDFRDHGLPIRIGMHLGEVVFMGNNVFGDGVNIASRIETMGIPGSILVSSAIRNQLKNKSGFELTSLGSFEFKNVTDPMEVFALKNAGLTVPKKSQMEGKFRDPAKKPDKKLWYAGVMAMIVALLFAGYFFTSAEVNPEIDSLNESRIKTIAVLPFINLNNSADLEYFSGGVTQEIIDELAKISSIGITAFSTVYQYKNQEKSQLEIAKELGVQYLISGSSRFFEEDQRVKLSVELLNPYTNERIWNSTFDEELKDASSIQLAVAKNVAENLDIELTISEAKDLENPNTLSGEAFRLFLQAKAEINTLSLKGFENGTRLLEEALELDPNYTQALTLLAWRYTVGASADLIPGNKSTFAFVDIAQPLLDRAIQLDPKSSDIHLIRGNLKLYSQSRVRDAKQDVDRAFELNSWPRIPTNYCICTAVSLYIANNNYARAKEVGELAKKIDPGHALYDWDLGGIALKGAKFPEAIHHYKTAVNKADIPMFNAFLGTSYYYNGQYEEALIHLHNAYNKSPLASRLTVSALSNTYYKMGDLNKSDRYLQELLDRAASGEYNLNLFIATSYLVRNDVQQSLTFLEKGVDQKDFGFAVFISMFPVFRALESEPRFQKVLERIQSPGIHMDNEIAMVHP